MTIIIFIRVIQETADSMACGFHELHLYQFSIPTILFFTLLYNVTD